LKSMIALVVFLATRASRGERYDIPTSLTAGL
jgi:hypothetical protein